MASTPRWTLAAGPLAAAVVWFGLQLLDLDRPAVFVAALTAWTAVWWVLEPIPIPATSMLPFAALPLGGWPLAREGALPVFVMQGGT